jgi:FkbH-like protein
MSAPSIILISDFNVEPLARVMTNLPELAGAQVVSAPYGQVYQSLGTQEASTFSVKFLWTRPEGVVPSFSRSLNYEDVDHELVIAEVEQLADAILASTGSETVFVASWNLAPSQSGYGLLDWRPGLGLSHLLAKMNLRLAERLAQKSNIYVLDSARWFSDTTNAETTTMWYAAKVPYSLLVLQRAATDVARALSAIGGDSRRLIVLDLDNTLWGGVVGEVTWEGLRLGGHDHAGEAFKAFQKELKALSNRGIQLALISKNDETVALEAIDQHPEMLIRRSDLAGWRINWQDKASNMAALLEEINLGPKSVVFIDDNPAERDRVSSMFPDIIVPDWPRSPAGYVDALRRLSCFDTASISSEDRARKAMYVAERERRVAREEVGNGDDWLRKIGTRVTVARLGSNNLGRATQLLNKTNQLNLSTRRLTDAEFNQWALGVNRSVLVLSAADSFGDMGIVGLVSVEMQDGDGRLVDFILSCRAMGRKIEETMLHLALEEVRELGSKGLEVTLLPTARNRPTHEVLVNAGIRRLNDTQFEIKAEDGFEAPVTVEILWADKQ